MNHNSNNVEARHPSGLWEDAGTTIESESRTRIRCVERNGNIASSLSINKVGEGGPINIIKAVL